MAVAFWGCQSPAVHCKGETKHFRRDLLQDCCSRRSILWGTLKHGCLLAPTCGCLHPECSKQFTKCTIWWSCSQHRLSADLGVLFRVCALALHAYRITRMCCFLALGLSAIAGWNLNYCSSNVKFTLRAVVLSCMRWGRGGFSKTYIC